MGKLKTPRSHFHNYQGFELAEHCLIDIKLKSNKKDILSDIILTKIQFWTMILRNPHHTRPRNFSQDPDVRNDQILDLIQREISISSQELIDTQIIIDQQFLNCLR